MAQKSTKNLQRLARRLFDEDAAQAEFLESLGPHHDYPVAIVWKKARPESIPFKPLSTPPWIPDHIDLVSIQDRPGRHELHNAGHYYCLDPSSVFMMAACAHLPRPEIVLDACSSPGGKTMLADAFFQPNKIISNEVIGKRLGALISNLRRCEVQNSFVTSIDTSKFTNYFDAEFDLVLVDAPCSGQSLIPKGKESPGCFHPATINLNANRQRRILANSAKVVATNGHLIYMTCTYSLKENENNVDWFLKKHPDFEAIEIEPMINFQSKRSTHPTYRIWPNSEIGAGGFFAVLRRHSEPAESSNPKLEPIPVRWKFGD